MMICSFEPYNRIGKLYFGMKRDDVKKVINTNPEEFKKNKFSKNTADDFESFHVFYNEKDEVEAVEVFGKNISVIYEDINIFQKTFFDLKAFLSNYDKQLQIKTDGLISLVLGIAAYSPALPNDNNASIESLLFFDKNYY